MAPRVLVADADVNLQTLLNALLDRIGATAEFAEDGKRCLEKLQAAAYDAILLELLLPEIDGLGILQKMQRQKPDVLAHVIVLSVAHEKLLQKARSYPVHSVIRKPFDVAELVKAVQSCCA